jgi:DNA-binding NtrC family response regulator
MLLRVIETGVIEKVGDDRKSKIVVDVRFIAATNKNLEQHAEQGSFRDDLFHRLNVFPIHIPPLRERREDIVLLIEYFLPAIASRLGLARIKFDPEAHSGLLAYYWPGNVRELQNLLERLIIRYPGETIHLHQLPSKINSVDDDQVDVRDPDYYVANRLYNQMIRDSTTFWQVVYDPYMDRDLTRGQVRAVIKKALLRTGGNYRQVISLFNLPPDDYKKFLNFLRKHECQLEFKEFRKITGASITAVA